MESLRWVKMTDDELRDFLGRGGTGVISFSTAGDDPPFTMPVSYGYDADSTHFYFRLAFPPGSGKKDVVDNAVAFVTYGETDVGYRSVVASGQLEELTDLPYDSAAVQRMWSVQIPLVDVFEQPPDELSFRNFRLVPDTVSGRKQIRTDE